MLTKKTPPSGGVAAQFHRASTWRAVGNGDDPANSVTVAYMTEGVKIMMDKRKRPQFHVMSEIFSEEYPLSNYAFSLYLFIKRVYEESIKDGITDLYFLSREGQFLKHLFDKYIENKQVRPNSHYMYISRRAAVNASLQCLEDERFTALKTSYRSMSIAAFLKSLDFTDREIAVCTENMEGYPVQYFYEDFFESDAFMQLKANSDYRCIYEEKRISAHDNFVRYLNKIGYDSGKKVAVVDVGWNGTIQDALYRLGMRNALYGYYIGTNQVGASADNVKKGLLFDIDPIFGFDRHNFEYICVADHGATIGYDENGMPVIADDGDCDLYKTYYKEVQQSITNKFIRLDLCFGDKPIDYATESYFLFFHTQMLLKLNRIESEILENSKKLHPDTFATGGIYKPAWIKKQIWYFYQNCKLYMAHYTVKKRIVNNEHT